MLKVSKEITMCINIILMIFISHVGGVEGYVHNMHMKVAEFPKLA